MLGIKERAERLEVSRASPRRDGADAALVAPGGEAVMSVAT
jgi:hypothetical protein